LVVVAELQITCALPQASVAPAFTTDARHPGIVNSLGLQPRLFVAPHTANGCTLNTGGVVSSVQVMT